MKVLHTITTVGPGSFGLGPVALNLAKEQNALGVDSAIWCLDSEKDKRWASASSGLPVGKICRFSNFGPKLFGFSLQMERRVRKHRDVCTVLHQHVIWTALSRLAAVLKGCNETANVITLHGALERWCLQKSWWKKRIALALYEKNNLNDASCLHAVGENEIGDCRDFGLTNPIAVIPNGVSKCWLNSRGDAEAFRELYNIPRNKRVILFLSRITPKKGLPMLLEAIRELGKNFNDWQLLIAGVDEFGHQAEIIKLITNMAQEKRVSLIGPLYGQQKRDAFSAAELFVLPSHSEGAPIAILEALAAKVPVLTTKASPWQELESEGCGWWSDISAGAIAELLKEAIDCSSEHLKCMGSRGWELVNKKYTWNKSAKMTIQLYEWLLGRNDQPEFVVTD
ncbi:glycosyltransferase [Planctomycetota bacterium]